MSYVDGAVDEDGVIIELHGGAQGHEACDPGETLSVERVDANLEGATLVEWTVDGRAHIDPEVVDDGGLRIHLD